MTIEGGPDLECTWWPDEFFGVNINHCCVAHDLGGSDVELFACVAAQHPLFFILGAVMLVGIFLFRPIYLRIEAMRKINEVIVHCSATPEGRHVTVGTIRDWHTKPKSQGGRGWNDIGYHYVIYIDGSRHEGRPVEKVGAHVAGRNTGTVGICYVGGVAKDGVTPKDTRTPAQKRALVELLSELLETYPKITKISGHRDYAAKACPSFDARSEYASLVRDRGHTPQPSTAHIPDKRIAYLQRLLMRAGHSPGLADGIVGPKTRQATKAYQEHMGLSVTGELDTATVKLLRETFEPSIDEEIERDIARALDKDNRAHRERQIDEVLADHDKSPVTSTTAIASATATAGGLTAAASKAVEVYEEAVDVAGRAAEATGEAVEVASPLWQAAPWAIVAVVVVGAGAWIIRERVRKARAAKRARLNRQ